MIYDYKNKHKHLKNYFMNEKKIDEMITPLIDAIKDDLKRVNNGRVNSDYFSGYNDGLYKIGKEIIKRIQANRIFDVTVISHKEEDTEAGQIFISDLVKP